MQEVIPVLPFNKILMHRVGCKKHFPATLTAQPNDNPAQAAVAVQGGLQSGVLSLSKGRICSMADLKDAVQVDHRCIDAQSLQLDRPALAVAGDQRVPQFQEDLAHPALVESRAVGDALHQFLCVGCAPQFDPRTPGIDRLDMLARMTVSDIGCLYQSDQFSRLLAQSFVIGTNIGEIIAGVMLRPELFR